MSGSHFQEHGEFIHKTQQGLATRSQLSFNSSNCDQNKQTHSEKWLTESTVTRKSIQVITHRYATKRGIWERNFTHPRSYFDWHSRTFLTQLIRVSPIFTPTEGKKSCSFSFLHGRSFFKPANATICFLSVKKIHKINCFSKSFLPRAHPQFTILDFKFKVKCDEYQSLIFFIASDVFETFYEMKIQFRFISYRHNFNH